MCVPSAHLESYTTLLPERSAKSRPAPPGSWTFPDTPRVMTSRCSAVKLPSSVDPVPFPFAPQGRRIDAQPRCGLLERRGLGKDLFDVTALHVFER